MSNNSLNIVVDSSTERLVYIFDFMFKEVLNIPFVIIEKQNFKDDELPNLIHYGTQKPKNGLWFKSYSLLFEEDVREIKFEKAEYLEFKYPFAIGDDGVISFDPFALGFYFLSQYEEFKPDINLDQHGRFSVSKSKIAKYVELPMVEIAALIVKKELENNGFILPAKINKFSFQPTFDIDIAFAHIAKTLKRNLLGSAKLLVTGEFSQISSRLKVWTHHQKDCYDVFDVILDSLSENNLKAIFFALVAKNTRYDNNNSPKSKQYIELLSKLAVNHLVELHSSYFVTENIESFENEKTCLESILQHSIHSNRQHFLRYRLPNYWHTLISHGITDDYSVGYTDRWGYRSGTSLSHKAFDLNANKILNLNLHPFVFMDTALKKMYKDDVVLITDKMIQIIDESRQNGFPLIGVWHNYAMPADSLFLDSFTNVMYQINK